jgi:hypothetical protein
LLQVRAMAWKQKSGSGLLPQPDMSLDTVKIHGFWLPDFKQRCMAKIGNSFWIWNSFIIAVRRIMHSWNEK